MVQQQAHEAHQDEVFFVKDKVDDGEVKIEHLPAEKMWIDMHSKPSQGIRFETDRSELQNVPVHWPDETLPSYSTTNDASLSPQECVRSNTQKPQQSMAPKRLAHQRPMTWRRKSSFGGAHQGSKRRVTAE
jgi:hypothetical protein